MRVPACALVRATKPGYQCEDRQSPWAHDSAVNPDPRRRDHPVMDRRAFIGLMGGIVAAPLVVEGQQAAKVPRVGYLNPGSASDPLRQRRLDAFRQALRERGYVEAQNIVIESL